MAVTKILFYLVFIIALAANCIDAGYRWEVTVHTGLHKRAGMDDRAYLTMYGNGTETPRYSIHNSKKDFAIGAADVFQMPYNDIGNLTKIRIKQIGRDGWFLTWMEFTRKDNIVKKYLFSCHCWLKLGAWKDLHVLASGVKPSCDWRVIVWTGAQRRAGTDDNVYLEIYGNGTRSSYYELNTPNDDLNRGARDVISIQAKYFTPEQIRLRIDGYDGWFPYRIELQRVDNNDLKYVFPIYEWFDSYTVKVRMIDVADPNEKPFCDWEVVVWTGLNSRADTDDNVYIEILGNGTKTSYYELDTSKDNFELGAREVFSFQSKCLTPEIMLVTIGGNDGWFLKRIELKRKDDTSKIYYFPCYGWLDSGGTQRLKALAPFEKSHCDWRVFVWTDKQKHADTDDPVYIEAFEDKISTSYHKLDNSKNNFERGAKDEFDWRSKCLAPTKIKVSIRGDDGWLLNRIELHRRDDKRLKYIFPCNCWLDDSEHKYINMLEANEQLCKWKVLVLTGKKSRAGTDDGVQMQIFENDVSTSSFELNNNGDDFESGAKDEFHLESKCLTPNKIKVTIRGNDGWFLSKIELQRKDNISKKYIFACDCWLDDSEYKYIDVQK